jgi:hypothetical protein
MKYNPDHAGVAAYLRTSPELAAELHRRALMGVATAAALAPRRTGALAASGHVEFDGPNEGAKHDRMQYSVVFDVPHAAAATWIPGPDERSYLLAAKAIMEAGG